MTCFIVMGMPRTGSTLLMHGLSQHPQILAFGELFHPNFGERYAVHRVKFGDINASFGSPLEDPFAFLRENVFSLRNESKPAVGFKLFVGYQQGPVRETRFSRLTRNLISHLKEKIPDTQVIHIHRANYLDVLASRKMAEITGTWTVQGNGGISDTQLPRIAITIGEARYFFQEMQMADQLIASRFASAAYIRVDYDRLADRFDEEMARVYRFLGISAFQPAIKTHKQMNRPLDDIISNYEALRAAFRGTEFRGFFEPLADPLPAPAPAYRSAAAAWSYFLPLTLSV